MLNAINQLIILINPSDRAYKVYHEKYECADLPVHSSRAGMISRLCETQAYSKGQRNYYGYSPTNLSQIHDQEMPPCF